MRRTYAALACVLSIGAMAFYPEAAAADSGEAVAEVFKQQLRDADLAVERGGAQQPTKIGTQVFNSMVLSGDMDNVTVMNNITGNNIIDGGSFAGAEGFPMVIQNSGNGVLIQNATILNVTIEQ
jgi:hypothetical protein